MKKTLLLILLPLLALVPACDKPPPPDGVPAAAAAVEKLRAAMLSGKAADLSAITAGNLVYIHSNGMVETKAEFVEGIAGGRSRYLSVELSDPLIKVSGDTAIARHTFAIEAIDSGKRNSVKVGVMTVWQKQDGEWKLIARQAQKPPAQQPAGAPAP